MHNRPNDIETTVAAGISMRIRPNWTVAGHHVDAHLYAALLSATGKNEHEDSEMTKLADRKVKLSRWR